MATFFPETREENPLFHGSEASMLTCGNKTLPLRKSRALRVPLSTTGGARKQ